MKVDLLMTDAILPPNFDKVRLGPKEKSKLISMGKNPFRTEGDVLDGIAVNCEYEEDADNVTG